MANETISQAQGLVNALHFYQSAAVPALRGKGADMRSLASAIRKFVVGASPEDKALLERQIALGRTNIVEGLWRELEASVKGLPEAKAPVATAPSVPGVDKYQSLMDKLGVLQSQVEVLTSLVQGMAKAKRKPKQVTAC